MLTIRNTGKSPEEILRLLKAFEKNALTIAGVEAVKHFKNSFRNQGFTDTALEPWEGRKGDTDKGRGILIGKGSAHLSKAVRILNRGTNSITVGVDVDEIPYAEIHNDGGTITIPITPAMRGHFWKMYYGLGGNIKEASKTMGERSSYNPGISAEANFYKAMALTKKKALTVKIPKRKFIGVSKVLNDNITKRLDEEIRRIFN